MKASTSLWLNDLSLHPPQEYSHRQLAWSTELALRLAPLSGTSVTSRCVHRLPGSCRISSPTPVSVSQSSVFQAVVSPAVPPSGGEPTPAPETYETVSRNLKSYPATLSYTAGELSSISYATPGGAVVKTLNRTAGRLASIVLSGALPSGIATTKTLTYSGDTLTGVAYG